jgi:hypothetical protein
LTRRAAVVLVADLAPGLRIGPPDPVDLRLAFCEDVYDVLAGLDLLDAGVAVRAGADRDAVASLTWPGAPIVELGAERARPELIDSLTALAGLGYDQATVVSLDAPDLPGLMIGKLFRALGRADVAVCPAEAGGLVAFAAHLPLAAWVLDAGVDLDTPDALAALGAAAPTRLAVGVGPGWHRVRTPEDLDALDPGLEGWAATRALRDTGPAG